MKIKIFDVVELNNGNRATILEIKGNIIDSFRRLLKKTEM